MTKSACIARVRRYPRPALLALIIGLADASSFAAQAADVKPPAVYTVTPTGVNVSDGGFTFTNTDLSIGTLSLERFWLGGSLNDPNAPFFGVHMSNNFDIYVKRRVITTKGPPATQVYRANVYLGNTASGTYDIAYTVTPPLINRANLDAFSGVLEQVGNAYVYTNQAGTVYTFDPNVQANGGSTNTQRVASIVYSNGRKLTFSYDGGDNLKMVSSSDGYAIVFENVSGRVIAACGFNLARSYVTPTTTCANAAIKTTYGYVSGQLTSFTDPLAQTTQYDYVNQQISCIRPPGYANCKIANTYSSNGTFRRVYQQTLADGTIWTFSGGSPNTRIIDYVPEDGDNATSITAPGGTVTGFTFTNSSPYSFTDANGQNTYYRYVGGVPFYEPSEALNYGTLLERVIFPEGDEYTATYNSQSFNLPSTRTWKPKPGSALANRTQQFSYASCDAPNTRQMCVQPLSITDSNNNVTDYQYNSHGQLIVELKPAPTPGAPRPLKLYTYDSRYAYVLNAAGSLVPAATPVSLTTAETWCQTVAGSSIPTCDPSAQQTVTTFEYGPDGTADNLLVRGRVLAAGGRLLRTCYQHDLQGNKIAETSPRAGLSSC